MATLGATGAIAYVGLGGSSKDANKATPPIRADSGEEEKFIRCDFLMCGRGG